MYPFGHEGLCRLVQSGLGLCVCGAVEGDGLSYAQASATSDKVARAVYRDPVRALSPFNERPAPPRLPPLQRHVARGLERPQARSTAAAVAYRWNH